MTIFLKFSPWFEPLFRIKRIAKQCGWTQISYSSIIFVQTRYHLNFTSCWGHFGAAVCKRSGNSGEDTGFLYPIEDRITQDRRIF